MPYGPGMSVLELKKLLQSKTGIPVANQRLIFSGRTMEDSMILYDSFDRSTTIHMVARVDSPGGVGTERPTLVLSSDLLSTGHHYDFRDIVDVPGQFSRGGKPYTRPCGCYRYALSVLGKYDGGNNMWFKGDDSVGAWPVSYHTTNEKFEPGYREEGSKQEEEEEGKEEGKEECGGVDSSMGVYTSPNPDWVLECAKEFDYGGERYKIIFQDRVNPATMKEMKVRGKEYWFAPSGADIRPYGICVMKKKK